MKKIYSLWKTRLLAVMLIATVFGLSAKATVWPIPNSAADTLEHFIENTSLWNPGDTILLTDFGPYIVNDVIDIHQTINLVGDPSLSARPKLHFYVNGLQILDSMLSVTVKDLVLSGYNIDSTNRASWILQSRKGKVEQTFYDLVFDNVEASGFKGGIDLENTKHCYYESIVINNCVWYDFAGEYAIDPNVNHAKNITVTNSTFYLIDKGFLKNPDYYKTDPGWDTLISKTFVIDHNTFYKVGGNNEALIQNNDPLNNEVTLTFTNNIVNKLFHPGNSRPFRINLLAGSYAFANSCIYDYDVTEPTKMKYNFDTIVNQGNIDSLNIYKIDPGFADTTNFDFSYSKSSLLATAGNDNNPIGDPRWAPEMDAWTPGPNTHLIPNDSIDILKAYFDTLVDGSLRYKAGDTLLLTSASQYTNTKFCYVTEDVVIMGDPRLSVKPSLYCEDFGFRLENDTSSLELNNFNVIGWDPIDSSSASNYLLQSRYAGGENLIFKGMECVGFKAFYYLNEGFIYDSIVVDDCIIHDLPNSSYNTFDFRKGKINYASVTNSTVYSAPRGIFGELWAADTAAGSGEIPFGKKLIFDHNTFYNVVGGSSFMAIHNIKDNSLDVTISNNIISTLYENTSSRPFRYDASAGSIDIANNVFHSFVSSRYNAGSYYGVVQDSLDKYYPGLVTQVNTDTNNPYFANPLEGSFMLQDSSSLLKAGTDGGPIGDPRWVPISGVSINPLSVAVVEGIAVTLTAEVNISGADKTVTWTVENNQDGTTGTATIDPATGVLSPISAGKVLVTATSNFNSALSDELMITIDAKILVTKITLTAKDLNGVPTTEISNRAGVITITATTEPGGASNKVVLWTISDDNLATIAENNIISADLTAKNCGVVTVTATAQDGSTITGTLDITITDQIRVSSVTVVSAGGANEITANGGTLQMEATVLPAEACIQEVDWSVNDEAIATIDAATGLLTAVSNGTVTVTARAKDGSFKSGTVDITVSNQTSSIFSSSVSNIQVLPNPASDFILIGTDKVADVVINNLVGAVVISTRVEPNAKIDVANLKAGIYIVNVKVGNEFATAKFIKE